MSLVSVFVMNMLCAMVPCDYRNPHPEIGNSNKSTSNTDIDYDSTPFLKNVRWKRLIKEDSYPIVSTKMGLLQGYSMRVMSGRRIFAFEGIPYGVAERFKVANPKESWTGIKTAFTPGPYCLQIHPSKMFRVIGSENCLFLNVYTPKVATESTSVGLPVIVFIHGGSYAFGAGSEFGPSYLLEKDVILVTLNYRVGVLGIQRNDLTAGFLSTGDEASPGNYGIKDQALALKWIHENIASFGGNNSRVTLVGQSAGAAAVHLHMLSNLTRNYFQKAVVMSGSAFSSWALQTSPRARHWTHKIARQVNCYKGDSVELVECLRKTDPNWLVALQMNLFEWMPFPPVLFAPVIEPPNPTSFITESPDDIYKKGTEGRIPAIFSMTSQEGYFTNYALNGLMKIGSFINNVPKYLPLYLDYNYIAKNTKEITEKVLSYYVGSSPTKSVPIQMYAEMATDRMFVVPMNKAIKEHSRVAPAYASLFAFLGKYNQGLRVAVPPDELGVAHSEDLYYIFNASLYIQGFKQKDEEAELSKILVNLLTNFASKGEPLYTNVNGTDIKIWDRADSGEEEIRMLQVQHDIKMIDDPFVSRRQFWESLGLEDSKPFVNNFSHIRQLKVSKKINYYERKRSLLNETTTQFDRNRHNNNNATYENANLIL